MPSPGRRHGPSAISLFALTFFLFSPATLAAYAVLGIDLGTEYIKAALVKPGIPLEIVLTKDSKRKEISALAFKAPRNKADQDSETFPERLYGGDALALSARIPGDVYPNLKHLLGVTHPYRDAAVEQYSNRYPALRLEEDTSGLLQLRSKAFSQDELFSIEELLAMELKTIKGNAESMAGAGSTVREAVFTIPPFYTVDERRAIERAAELADMKAIGLVSDGLAVGVNYATSRTFEKAETHLIYDMGAGYTTATIIKFAQKNVKDVGRFNKTVQEVAVLATGWDRTLGGDALNDLIVGHMIEQFTASKGAKSAQLSASDVKSNGRTAVKLNREAEKVRHVLSANTATSAFFEGLQDDVDFRYKLSRQEFEELAKTFSGRVDEPITSALTKAKLTLKDIDSIILHGGAVRTPFVQTALEAIVGDAAKLKTNVNADEAAVFGAAFKAAKLSPAFRVKEIRDIDTASYPVSITWTTGEKERKQGLFIGTSQIGNVKHVPIKMQEDFTFTLSQSVPILGTEESVSKAVVKVDILNLTATISELEKSYSCSRTNITTTLDLQLDPINGVPQLVKAFASCESSVEKKAGVMDGVRGLFGFGKDSQKPLTDDDDLELNLEDETSSAISTSTTSSKASKASKSAKGSSASETAVNKLHTIPLSFTTTQLGMIGPSAESLLTIRERLTKFDTSDDARRAHSETFNMLEGLTYRVRDMLTDASFIAVSSAPQREDISALLSKTQEWVSMEGASATTSALREKLSDLMVLVNPIQQRKKENTDRPQLVQALENALNQSQSVMSIIRGSIDRAASAAASSASSIADAASSAAEAATSTIAEAVSSITAPASADDSASATAPDDLDDEPSTSTTSTRKPPKPTVNPLDTTTYTEEDYTRLSDLYDVVTSWLKENVAAQAALDPHEEPVLRASDIEDKAKMLGEASQELLRKMTYRTPPKYSSYSSSSRKPKSKSSKSKKAKKSASASATAVEDEVAATTASSDATETKTAEPANAEEVVDEEGGAKEEL
jgi:hypoxia up-regulated 1